VAFCARKATLPLSYFFNKKDLMEMPFLNRRGYFLPLIARTVRNIMYAKTTKADKNSIPSLPSKKRERKTSATQLAFDYILA
jgi:hypothetical protein